MLNGNDFKWAVISGANNIVNHKKDVDALNIFPVPDGDTGTNMFMTQAFCIEKFWMANAKSKTVMEIFTG